MRKIFLFFIATLFSVSIWADCYVAGTFTSWESGWVKMTNVSGSHYVAKIQISTGIDAYDYVQFKIVDNGGWYGDGTSFTASNLHSWKNLSTSGDNMSLHVEEAGTYFTFIYDQNSKYFAVIFPDTKIIAAGSDALFGSDWDASDTNNALTTTITDNYYTYTWTAEDIELAAGEYKFKVVIDEDFNNKSYPANDYEINVANGKSGTYDVTITFDALTQAVSADTTLKDAHPVVPAMKLCRKWALDPGQEYNEVDFTPAQDGLTATLTQTFAAADLGEYEFALKKGGTWASNGSGTTFDREHPSAEITGDEGYMKIFVDVTTAITFTWTYATNTLTITYPSLPAKPVIAAWIYANSGIAVFTPAQDGNSASWSKHLSKGTYTFYILHNGSKRCLDGNNNTRYEFHRNWNSDAITGCGTQTEMIINTDIPGDYTLRWTYESNLLTIVYPDSLEIEFHLNFKWGEENWELKKLSASEDSWFTTSLNINPAGTYEYQIRKYDPNHNTPQTVWYGAQNYGATMTSDNCTNWQLTTDNDYHVNLNANKTGDYTFEFNAATAKMNVVYPTATALDHTDASTKAVKRIVNGQLVIEREGKLYNALGAEVK